jgi:fucose 4-O-acetylase-like acetyltransferase
MPLFSFLSGYVYAHRPFQGHAVAFIQGKAQRLLLPMLTLGTIFAIVQSMTQGTNARVTEWALLHIIPVAHFWFLEALFIVFLIVLGLEACRVLSRPLGFTVVWIISVLLQRFIDVPPYFALDGVVYLMPFFLAGLACKRFELDSKTSRSVAMAALLVAATWLWVLWGPQPLPTRDTLFHGRQSNFFTQLHLTNTYALLLLGTPLGIVGPIIAAKVISRSARWNRWLLGSSTKEKFSPTPTLLSDVAVETEQR